MIRSITIIFFLTNIVAVSRGQDTPHIVDDQFAEHPFEVALTPATLHQVVPGKLSSETKAEPNKHTGEMDTLLILRSANDEFTFLKTVDKVWFVEATISGRGVKLAKGIRIGLPKRTFISIFGVDEKFDETNPIIVTNTIEYGFYHTFYFEKGKLAKIVLNAWPD